MALKGTLKDFGIAEILQLIGQQQKTGTLIVKAKGQDVRVMFNDGSIVKAELTNRKRQELIGAMLVRAGMITEAQLSEALTTQRSTLMKLGNVLIQSGAVSEEKFKALFRLQTTETLNKLFQWKAGNYEFVQGAVEYDSELMTPLRAEAVLMDGFRMVDEWPVIRKKLPPLNATFETLKPLPTDDLPPAADDLDAAFGGPSFGDAPKEKKSKGEFQTLGENEKTVYALIAPGVDINRLIDRSCLGEFETCKALVSLLNSGYVRTSATRTTAVSGVPALERVKGLLTRVVVPAAVLASLAWASSNVQLSGLQGAGNPSRFLDPAVQRFIGQQQLSSLETAVDVYRMERGELPKTLDSLVEAGLLEKSDLTYPWRDRYHYRTLSQGQFVLLPPLR
jgi:hypothetical protein